MPKSYGFVGHMKGENTLFSCTYAPLKFLLTEAASFVTVRVMDEQGIPCPTVGDGIFPSRGEAMIYIEEIAREAAPRA